MSYAILCNPGYHAGDVHGRDKEFLLRSESDGAVIALATQDEAARVAAMMEPSGGVHLDHNQHSLPTYAAVAAPAGVAQISVERAMRLLDLHHDFMPDGSRKPVQA